MAEFSRETIELIISEFEKYLKGYTWNVISYEKFSKVYTINDSLIILLSVYESEILYTNFQGLNRDDLTNNKYVEPGIYGNKSYSYEILELTFNEINFKFNCAKFRKNIEQLIGEEFIYLPIEYHKFKGGIREWWAPETPSLTEKIDRELPVLN